MTNSRNKGKNYENTIAKLFRAAGWEYAKRHLEFQSDEAEEGRDLDGTWPFAVQIKCWKKAPPITTLLQITPTNSYKFPIAVLKRTRSQGTPTLEVAVIPLDLFFDVIGLLEENDLLTSLV